MRTHHPLRLKTAIRIASLGLFAWTAGCNIIPPAQEDATRYYLLSEPMLAGAGRAEGPGGLKIGLKEIVVAGYLRHREIVVRSGANEVAFKDYERWAEPLDSSIFRALRAGLLGAPPVGQVLAPPFSLEGERDCDVSIQVIRCEGTVAPGGGHTASFAAMVDITTAGAEPRSISRHVFTAPEAAWNGKDYGQLAGLLSHAVALLAADISASLPEKSG